MTLDVQSPNLEVRIETNVTIGEVCQSVECGDVVGRGLVGACGISGTGRRQTLLLAHEATHDDLVALVVNPH